ncbi:glycosyltransferase family 4 protein [Streptomyces odontomachi]|uniref:glycosyltransferase family 4 protein n=1 Tax=Streptomyces odontomachi TaxID=2944940 RepID=UPI00210BE25E|nr:glycosyltransferase family 4 protein [Streptomyces sp. ODS25]
MKITFLLHDVYGIGGTIRTTLNLAGALADHHQVEIVSMRRHRTEPRFSIDPRIRLTPLVDTRKGSPDLSDPLHDRPARVFPSAESRYRQYSLLTDARAREYLRHCDADVLIGTRPGVNVYLARFGPPGALRIAQEHLSHDAHRKRLRAELAPHYRRLDALVTMTEADAAVYRRRMPLPGVRVLAVPNSVPEPQVAPSDGTAKVVAAGGRLARGKRYDVLVDAFAVVADKHPDWRLRIYGQGPERESLARLIADSGLQDAVRLMGVHAPLEPEFAKASLVAVASDAESFGMTIVEAMRCGVPVVSTDCPHGPAEIIHDGVDGRLVPVRDAPALAKALIQLIEDEHGRRRMAATARTNAARFDPALVAERYGALFVELDGTRGERARARARGAARARVRDVLRWLRLLGAARWAAGHLRRVARAGRKRPATPD